MKRMIESRQLTFLFRVFFFLATLPATLAVAGDSSEGNLTTFSANLPLIHLITEKPGEAISKEEVQAGVVILNSFSNNSADLLKLKPLLFSKVKVRGNGSAKFAKHQYDLEFIDPKNADKKVKIDLLGLPEHSKWVLAAPYTDRALIRNSFAFAMARSLTDEKGNPWYAPRTKAIELFIDRKYQGVYTVTEKIDNSKNRLNLGKVEIDTPEKSPFMVKVEHKFWQDKSEFFRTEEGSFVTYYEPKPKAITELFRTDREKAKRLVAQIQVTMHRFEKSILAIPEGDKQSYLKIIEPKSFQNYILIQEVFKNLDGYRRSLFLNYKDGLLRMGPVWDFDLSLANLKLFGQMNPEGFQVGHDRYIDGNAEIFWFRTLLKDSKFRHDLVASYHELRQPGQALSTERVMGTVDGMTDELLQAQSRNFQVWNPNCKFSDGPLIAFIPKYKEFHYPSVVEETRDWLRQRLDWLDKNIERIGK